MKLYLKLLNGDLFEFLIDIHHISSTYEIETKKISIAHISAKELGYTYKVHFYRNIKIQFINCIRKTSRFLKVLTDQCYVCFTDDKDEKDENKTYDLFTNNMIHETSLADLILSNKIVDHSILFMFIVPLYNIDLSTHALSIYLGMNKYEIENDTIVWLEWSDFSKCLMATIKKDKNFEYITYRCKNDIPLEKCIDIAKSRLELL